MSSESELKPLVPNVVAPLDERISTEEKARIQQRIDGKTKPLGALGKLEVLMTQLVSCALTRAESAPFLIKSPRLLVFAGDHGIAEEGVSIASSEVTAQMVDNFLAGGASVNVCARQVDMPLNVVDCGILYPRPLSDRLIIRRLGARTEAIHLRPAMTLQQAHQGIMNGRHLVHEYIDQGMDLLCVGEMGIGNTSAAAALMAGLAGLPARRCVGAGTGIDSRTLRRKCELIEMALALHVPSAEDDPVRLAACLSGYEFVTMAGAIIEAAVCGVPTVLDGFVSCTSAYLACRLVPAVRDYLIFSHLGSEHGHTLLLELLDAEPLMTLHLRIGEGTGGALAIPLLHSALACYEEMASFSQAGISL